MKQNEASVIQIYKSLCFVWASPVLASNGPWAADDFIGQVGLACRVEWTWMTYTFFFY